MMERMPTVGQAGSVGRFKEAQIAQRSTWAGVPDNDVTFASMHIVHMIPANGSTETRVNPIDPGDGYYVDIPGGTGKVVPAGRLRG